MPNRPVKKSTRQDAVAQIFLIIHFKNTPLTSVIRFMANHNDAKRLTKNVLEKS